MRFASVTGVCCLAFGFWYTSTAVAQEGTTVFETHCASCHIDTAATDDVTVPSAAALRDLAPEAILNSLLNGRMRIQATPLTDTERRAVSEFL
ncbi:MAG TPA: c-type cytochrome, partial [Gammaproteobacteria bacterium]|nr:c-type cytochrome [Gammaproteobacteria bacterium]